MTQTWDLAYKILWDDRYKTTGYAYGKAPNEFFKEWLQKFQPGSIIMPADGEGRNGVFAARSGWTVTSYDLSPEGRTKAMQLAKEEQVTLEYIVGDLDQLTLTKDSFDAIGLIYAHFAAGKKSSLHRKLVSSLKYGGVVIFEAFSKKHLEFVKANPQVGGPKDIDMLFSESEIKDNFAQFEILLLEETEIHLDEGNFHKGIGSVIRFVGRKLA